ncbi:hypothetical protein PISMIDRAFT_677320 [Pisolithus microcarpus 441]|uniref:Uncharacterized protein n=1 Tax=Pisolithus microcarpus 441 TaxID=765257 RepID=A0A0C9ZSS6_9AGAM|nr:hypothetical protein PISMIDRAFT_677320 [Pisolithus microcarpus 441]
MHRFLFPQQCPKCDASIILHIPVSFSVILCRRSGRVCIYIVPNTPTPEIHSRKFDNPTAWLLRETYTFFPITQLQPNYGVSEHTTRVASTKHNIVKHERHDISLPKAVRAYVPECFSCMYI